MMGVDAHKHVYARGTHAPTHAHSRSHSLAHNYNNIQTGLVKRARPIWFGFRVLFEGVGLWFKIRVGLEFALVF